MSSRQPPAACEGPGAAISRWPGAERQAIIHAEPSISTWAGDVKAVCQRQSDDPGPFIRPGAFDRRAMGLGCVSLVGSLTFFGPHGRPRDDQRLCPSSPCRSRELLSPAESLTSAVPARLSPRRQLSPTSDAALIRLPLIVANG